MNNLHKIQTNNFTDESYALIWFFGTWIGNRVGQSGNAIVHQDGYYADGHWELAHVADMDYVKMLWKQEGGSQKIEIQEKYKHIKM